MRELIMVANRINMLFSFSDKKTEVSLRLPGFKPLVNKEVLMAPSYTSNILNSSGHLLTKGDNLKTVAQNLTLRRHTVILSLTSKLTSELCHYYFT